MCVGRSRLGRSVRSCGSVPGGESCVSGDRVASGWGPVSPRPPLGHTSCIPTPEEGTGEREDGTGGDALDMDRASGRRGGRPPVATPPVAPRCGTVWSGRGTPAFRYAVPGPVGSKTPFRRSSPTPTDSKWRKSPTGVLKLTGVKKGSKVPGRVSVRGVGPSSVNPESSDLPRPGPDSRRAIRPPRGSRFRSRTSDDTGVPDRAVDRVSSTRTLSILNCVVPD